MDILVQAGRPMGLIGLAAVVGNLNKRRIHPLACASQKQKKRSLCSVSRYNTHNTHNTLHNTYIFGTPYIRRGGVGAQRTRTGLGDNGGSGVRENWTFTTKYMPVGIRCALLQQQKRSFTALDSITWGFPSWNCRSWRPASDASR